MGGTALLPRGIKPKFPARCVVCGGTNDLRWTKIRGEAVGMLGFHKWLLRKSGEVMVPAHRACAWKLKRRLFGRNIGFMTLATALVLVWFAMKIYEVQMPFEFNRTTLCIAGLVIVVPILIIEDMYPSAFEFRVYKESIIYEFKNEDYAFAFEQLNETPATRKKRSGKPTASDGLGPAERRSERRKK